MYRGKVFEKHYYTVNAPGSFGSVRHLSDNSKSHVDDVTKWLEAQDAYTLHKPIRKRFPRRKTICIAPDNMWQIDLADVTNISRYNDNYKFILTCIDCYSRYAFAVPVKNKSALEVKSAFASILNDSGRRPALVQSDKGTEFLNAIFQSYLKDNDIRHYTSENDDIKCALAERFNRTLKSKMWRYFTYSKSLRFVDVLQQLVDSYNSTPHRSIKMAPEDVTRHKASKVQTRRTSVKKNWKFVVGDTVRISRHDNPFRKGYEGGWSREVFTVCKRFETNPRTYAIRDYSGEVIKGKFYAEELQRVKKDTDVFEVEKVLRTRTRGGKTEYYVRWFGYGPKHDSWVSDLVM